MCLARIYITSLDLFSISERMLYTVVIVASILCCYLLVKPLIAFLMMKKSLRLMSYLISSLIIFLFFLVVTLKIGVILPKIYQLFKFALQCLSIFGIGLLITEIIRYAKQKLDV